MQSPMKWLDLSARTQRQMSNYFEDHKRIVHSSLDVRWRVARCDSRLTIERTPQQTERFLRARFRQTQGCVGPPFETRPEFDI